MTPKSKQKGALLIEVMIAIGILATAIAAIINTVSQVNFSANILRDQSYARWVAENVIAEMTIERYWGSIGHSRKGDMSMGKSQWYWQSKVLEMESDAMRRVDITVSRSQNGAPDITLTAFIGDPEILQ